MATNREKLIYKIKEHPLDGNKIMTISDNLQEIMKGLGARVINNACILSDGVPTEAYGYYEFPKLGAVVTIALKYDWGFDATLLGFEVETEEYSNIKNQIKTTLKKAGLE